MFMNCYTIAKMGDENKSHSASKYGKGNVKNRKAKSLERITPRSKSGACIKAVLDDAGNIVKVDGNELWVPA